MPKKLFPAKTFRNATLTNANQLDVGVLSRDPVWTRLRDPALQYSWEEFKAKIIPVNGNVYAKFYNGYYTVYKLNTAIMRWEHFGSNDTPTSSYRFSYQDKFYAIEDNRSQLYSANIETHEVWSLASFPGTRANDVISFIIGSKGYMAGGYDPRTNQVLDQFWEYDIPTNQWTDKGVLPGGPRAGGAAFVIGKSVYYGLGYNTTSNNEPSHRMRDWHVLNMDTGTGTMLASFPGDGRDDAQGFIIDNKIYVGWGRSRAWLKDLWQFDPANNTWRERTKCPEDYYNGDNTSVFQYGNAGYVVTGTLYRFWKYSKIELGTVPVPAP